MAKTARKTTRQTKKTTPAAPKKRNPQDATLNLHRANVRKIAGLVSRVKTLEERVDLLVERMNRSQSIAE